jgi:hypothetical protein
MVLATLVYLGIDPFDAFLRASPLPAGGAVGEARSSTLMLRRLFACEALS